MKNRTEIPVEKLMINEVLEKDTILVVYDQLSKIAYFVVITEETY